MQKIYSNIENRILEARSEEIGFAVYTDAMK